jgi:hypothetical protein
MPAVGAADLNSPDNGLGKGHINPLKMLKRVTYAGADHFPLGCFSWHGPICTESEREPINPNCRRSGLARSHDSPILGGLGALKVSQCRQAAKCSGGAALLLSHGRGRRVAGAGEISCLVRDCALNHKG